MEPKLDDVPDEDWLCPACALSGVGQKRRRDKEGEARQDLGPWEPVAIDCKRFDPVNDAAGMHAHLKEHGFVVVKEVADKKDIANAKRLLWDYLEEYGDGEIDRDDEESWWSSARAWAPNAKDGIIYGRGVGQSDFMWHLRLLPRVRRAFAAVWSRVADEDVSSCRAAVETNLQRDPVYGLRSAEGCGSGGGSGGASDGGGRSQREEEVPHGLRSRAGGGARPSSESGRMAATGRARKSAESIEEDLLVSFDGAGVYRPWRQRAQPTKGGWYHVDQNYWNVGRRGFACVQGLVTLTDVHEGTGGLVLFPGSHTQFERLSKLKRVRREYEEKSEDYVRFEEKELERLLVKNKERKMVASLVRARAGDMILWDSRVVHSGSPSWYSRQGAGAESAASVGGSTFPNLAREWREPEHELLRIAAYICMMPASLIPPRRLDHVLDVRQRIFRRGWATTHWPLEPTLGAKEEKPPVERPAPKNIVQRKLIGFR